jgi:hypothetical protein
MSLSLPVKTSFLEQSAKSSSKRRRRALVQAVYTRANLLASSQKDVFLILRSLMALAVHARQRETRVNALLLVSNPK